MTINHGLCYVVSEWLYHQLGGKRAGWTPMVMRIGTGTHWFLKHKSGFILDGTSNQFSYPPDYSTARGCGFLTKKMSVKTQQWVYETGLDMVGYLR